ncbi:NADH dehydrogenase [ubiquinone] 1 beta subcomplex subunit 3 [Trichoplax sp. H2]|nr:NADH dehydrogenase [ubiquinone] 1 beta subcomplex subunit 3 [Trichoplax sp. H2]|eukprot:RDD40687.1 NADH dehydrogenase [ubiquinone] 1 beta subcomplex subunit 3 [Trichoplax sp. H2]
MSTKPEYKALKKTLKDPWARFEAWRYDPRYNKAASFRKVFPGFLWGLGAFVIACGIEHFYAKPEDHGHHHNSHQSHDHKH